MKGGERMGVINVLDKHVAELIAAGEVVERPASVIKELVENAIDAGAKHITVEIKNGGCTFMRVTDDGCGIAKDDVRVAFLRHATSKVRVEDDLDRIATLGFRGEALASIAAVSRLQLITRHKDEETGTSYLIEGGEEQLFDDAGCPAGTTFVIRDLFFNIPARAKFLKKDVAEGNAVSAVLDKAALSHPEIAFSFIRDGKQVLKTFGDGKLLSAVYSVKPVHARPNRGMQNFFINGRYVKSRTAMAALEEAFKHSVMVGKFPSCVLNISLPYEMIDVNVHPAKIEVRFINERPVFDAVYHAVKSALMEHDTQKQVNFKQNTALHDVKQFNPFHNADAMIKPQPAPPKPAQPRPAPYAPAQPAPPPQKSDPILELDYINDDAELAPSAKLGEVRTPQNPFDIFSRQAVGSAKKEAAFDKTFMPQKKTAFVNEPVAPPVTQEEPEVVMKDNAQPVLFASPKNELKYIGEAFDTYILVERNQKELLLIDKHAAHERIIYEKLKAEKAGAASQILLQPVTVSLGKNEYSAAVEHLDMFRACAFDVEDFGNATLIVRSAPQYLDAAEVADCITEMADHIAQGKNDVFTEKMDWFYHNVACRSAIKAGNKSSAQELMAIVKTLEENPEIRYCPHGRPITIVMKKSEIERQFGRA